MREPGNCIVKRTHGLFVDDLKVYQESHNALKNANEIILQASHDSHDTAMECLSVRKSHLDMAR